MNVAIKKADISEIDKLMHWREIVLREVFSIPEEKNIDELLDKNRDYYMAALGIGTHISCFAYSGDAIVGCGGVLFYQEMPSPDNISGRCAYLMNIYTIPKMRKQGIGNTIVKWLIKEAKRAGAEKIYLEASKDAYSLYKEMGFEDMNGYLIYKE